MADMEDGQRSPAEPMVTDPDKAGTIAGVGNRTRVPELHGAKP